MYLMPLVYSVESSKDKRKQVHKTVYILLQNLVEIIKSISANHNNPWAEMRSCGWQIKLSSKHFHWFARCGSASGLVRRKKKKNAGEAQS